MKSFRCLTTRNLIKSYENQSKNHFLKNKSENNIIFGGLTKIVGSGAVNVLVFWEGKSLLTDCDFHGSSCLLQASSFHWKEHGYNGSSFGGWPRSFFVVIETLWVLCNCLKSRSLSACELAACASVLSL